MIPVGEVPVGMMLSLNCGCSGVRIGRADGPVLVVIERLCPLHSTSGRPLAKELDKWELVNPLTLTSGLPKA